MGDRAEVDFEGSDRWRTTDAFTTPKIPLADAATGAGTHRPYINTGKVFPAVIKEGDP